MKVINLESVFVGGRRSFYAGAELEYAYFIHSVHLLGRLLCFTNGRKFFPIKLGDSEGMYQLKEYGRLKMGIEEQKHTNLIF